jgi:hypothetical protein
MKKISFILLISYLNALSLSHNEIAQMVSKIQNERSGITLKELDDTPNPFVLYVPPKKVEMKKAKVKKVIKKRKEIIKPSVIYELTGILNYSAFINKKWYKVGDKIGEYRVIHIGKTTATLQQGKDIKVLKIKSKVKKINLFKGN